jgi:SAM-dependent methyltransferase
MQTTQEARQLNRTQQLPQSVPHPVKRVLSAGSGPASARQLHAAFRTDRWQEVRFDIDPHVKPDIVGSITDMSKLIGSESFDGVWSSHSLEHLYAHEVPLALGEFRRILKPGGFALITSPDIESIASMVLEYGLDHVAYTSPVGPITPHDMLFGHSASIERGSTFMAHNTGFTCASLGQRLLDAGFPVVLAKREGLALWALALMEQADKTTIQQELKAAGLDMSDDSA